MAKSLRSKMQRRLRTLRRDLAQPFYDKKEESKLAAQQAALAAPKVPVRAPKKSEEEGVEMGSEAAVASPAAASTNAIDVEMADAGSSKTSLFLKPGGGVGKKSKKKQKGKRGKGKYKRNPQY